VIAAAYDIGPQFGLYVEVHAATGARSSQIAELKIGDLMLGNAPLLQMPSSLKGKNRTTRIRKPVPIGPSLARRLKAAAGKRGAGEPLLRQRSGLRWNARAHRRPFIKAVAVAGLPDGATIYALRHTAITKTLLAGVPVRLVASSFDTSVNMLERTYSKNISSHGDELMRRVVFDTDTEK
jgi:integrase